MRLRLFPFAAALLLCAPAASAQTFEPGLLVRSTGDTLRGEIENGFWKEPPAFIRFRATAEGPSQVFRPRQLRAVRFTNGRYFRYEGLPIDHAAETRLEDLPRGRATNIKTDSLLAEVLVEGAATLFRVVRPGSLHLLLQRPTRPVLDLCSRQYLRQGATGGWEVAEGNNYRSQLALYLADCPAASRAAQAAAFTAAGLTDVAQAYNQTCSPARQPGWSGLQVATPRRRVSWQGGVLAGLRYNHLEDDNVAIPGCTDCAARPFGGLYAEALLPGRRTAVYGELSMGSFHNQMSRYAEVVTSTPDPRCVGCTIETRSVVVSTFRYQALMGTARIGVRYFFRLPHEQQLLFGLSYELNPLWNVKGSFQPGPSFTVVDGDIGYPPVWLVPALTAGWRWHRVSALADVHTLFFIRDRFVVRGSLAYRLGRNHDASPRQ
jgi:hypothetical protein